MNKLLYLLSHLPQQIVLFPNSCFKWMYSNQMQNLTLHASIILIVIYRSIIHLFALDYECKGNRNYCPRGLCDYLCKFSSLEPFVSKCLLNVAGWWRNPNPSFAYLDFISLQETVLLLLEQLLMKEENWTLIENGTGIDWTSRVQEAKRISLEEQTNLCLWCFLEAFFLGWNQGRQTRGNVSGWRQGYEASTLAVN